MGGEFKDQKPWMRLAFLFAVLGFALELLGGLAFFSTSRPTDADQACGVICIISYLLGLLLLLLLIYYEEGIKEKKVAKGFLITFLLLAGVAGLIRTGVWAKEEDSHRFISTYSTTLVVLGDVMAILAGIFGILDVAGVKSD